MSGQIGTLALRHQGIVSFEFRQGDPGYLIKPLYAAHQATESGICAALSCYWIIEHANGGSLWDRLYTIEGGRLVAIKNDYAMMIIQLQRWFMQRTQDLRNFMRMCGMDPHSDVSMGMARHILDPDAGKTSNIADRVIAWAPHQGALNAASFVTGLCNITTNEAYLVIKFGDDSWPRSGHACAAWVSKVGNQTVVLYFDPNYGEFYFENAEHFEDWALGYLFQSGYRGKYANVTTSEFGKLYLPPVRR